MLPNEFIGLTPKNISPVLGSECGNQCRSLERKSWDSPDLRQGVLIEQFYDNTCKKSKRSAKKGAYLSTASFFCARLRSETKSLDCRSRVVDQPVLRYDQQHS